MHNLQTHLTRAALAAMIALLASACTGTDNLRTVTHAVECSRRSARRADQPVDTTLTLEG
jgi:hypothetical protein